MKKFPNPMRELETLVGKVKYPLPEKLSEFNSHRETILGEEYPRDIFMPSKTAYEH